MKRLTENEFIEPSEIEYNFEILKQIDTDFQIPDTHLNKAIEIIHTNLDKIYNRIISIIKVLALEKIYLN